jgi:hypothetical protein
VASDVAFDADRIRPKAPAAELLDVLREAVDAWPQFDGDEYVSGADLVEWFTFWRRKAKAILANT